jgi:hypothetical protein
MNTSRFRENDNARPQLSATQPRKITGMPIGPDWLACKNTEMAIRTARIRLNECLARRFNMATASSEVFPNTAGVTASDARIDAL